MAVKTWNSRMKEEPGGPGIQTSLKHIVSTAVSLVYMRLYIKWDAKNKTQYVNRNNAPSKKKEKRKQQ